MSKLDIFRNPKFGAIHVWSPHHMAVTGWLQLIFVNNCKTEFRSFSYNYNSKGIMATESSPRTNDLNRILGGIDEICTS